MLRGTGLQEHGAGVPHPWAGSGRRSPGAIGENVGGWDAIGQPCEPTWERNWDGELGHSPGHWGAMGGWRSRSDCSDVGLRKIALAAVRKRLEGRAQGGQGAQAGAKSVFRRNISSCWDCLNLQRWNWVPRGSWPVPCSSTHLNGVCWGQAETTMNKPDEPS